MRRGDAAWTLVLSAAECSIVPSRLHKCSLLCDALCQLRRVPGKIQLRSGHVVAGACHEAACRKAACYGSAYDNT